MQNFLTRKKIVMISSALIVSLIILTERAFYFIHKGILNNYEKSFLEPIFVWSLAVFASGLTLYVATNQDYKIWLSRFLVWYLPLGLLMTFLTSPSMTYAFPNRLVIANLLAGTLLLLTILFVVIQFVRNRFVRK